MFMVCPTLGSMTAEKQNATVELCRVDRCELANMHAENSTGSICCRQQVNNNLVKKFHQGGNEICVKKLSFDVKTAKIGPEDLEIICLREIIKKDKRKK